MPQITVYGADWCAMTSRTRRFLDEKNVPYQYVDIDHDRDAAAWVAAQNDGKEKKPTLRIGDDVLRTPTNGQLEDYLRERGISA